MSLSIVLVSLALVVGINYINTVERKMMMQPVVDVGPIGENANTRRDLVSRR